MPVSHVQGPTYNVQVKKNLGISFLYLGMKHLAFALERPHLGSLLLAMVLAVLPLSTGCESLSFTESVRLMHNDKFPDARRTGIAALVTRFPAGQRPPYPDDYRDVAQHDTDETVRAMAIRALNICRDSSSTSLFIQALSDDSELVRLEAAKALANLPETAAVQPLIHTLSGTREMMTADGRAAMVSEDKDVRIAAADALRRYPTLDVARTLVGYLNESDFGVAWQSRQSLIVLTGQDLRYDQAAWLQYLVGPSKPFG